MGLRRAWTAAALALALVAAPAGAARASLLAVTRDAFVVSVERAVSAAAKARPAIEGSATAAALAVELESGVLEPTGVESGGRTMDPDLSVLRRLVRQLADARTPAARRDALSGITAQLSSLRQALGRPGPAAPSDPAALKELLAGRAPTTTSAARTNDWLGEQLRALVERVAGWLSQMSGTGRGIGGWVFYGILALAAAFALFFILRAVLAWRRGTLRRERGRGAREGERGPVVSAAADLPADALAHAERLAADGRRRDAVRALYGGAARRLVEAGAVRRMRTRTNAELLRDVRTSAPAAAASLSELTDRFEAAWYGHADPGDEGFLAARASFAAVLDAAGNLAPARAAPEGR